MHIALRVHVLIRSAIMTGSPSLTKKLPTLTLVLGGARSGKSALAERLATATGLDRHYIATADAWDAEMATRIAQHRIGRGSGWKTTEAPLDLVGALAGVTKGQVILVDCATLWLTNQLMADAPVAIECALLIAAVQACPAPVVIVSNEVGWGIVPDNALARAFRDHQGSLNQHLAAAADLVIGVMAGLPVVLKGQMPFEL